MKLEEQIIQEYLDTGCGQSKLQARFIMKNAATKTCDITALLLKNFISLLSEASVPLRQGGFWSKQIITEV